MSGENGKRFESVPVPESSGFLRFLYGTVPGRLLLKPLVRPGFSAFAGKLLSLPVSACLIRSFVRKYRIDLSDYESVSYQSFNDFFTRKILPGKRPADPDPDALIAPCDGLLSAYRIREGTVLPVKQSRYTAESLLRDGALASSYDGGVCLVFRLCVDHYHRYCFPADGTVRKTVRVPGVLHTVRPVALQAVPVFTENTREYAVIETERFGTVVQMEVGALLVGRIDNGVTGGLAVRGEEKGKFLYGGSTVILLLKKDAAVFPEELFSETEKGNEIRIRMGTGIGYSSMIEKS